MDSDDRGSGWKGIEALQAFLDDLVPGGSVIGYLMDRIPGVQRHKANELLTALLRLIELEPDRLIAELESRPLLRRLIWEAARAAADTEVDAKIGALALVACDGYRDDAKVDEGRLYVNCLRTLEPLHIRALVELAGHEPASDGDTVDLTVALDVSPATAELIANDLLRIAAAETGGLSFTGQHTKLRASSLGNELLRLLREAGLT